MVRRPQYVQRSRIVLGPTPCDTIISRCMSQSRASYAFWRSSKTSKRTASLVVVICWRRLASRVVVPVPRPARNPCSTSWNLMAAVIWRFRRLVTVFQSTSTSLIPLNSPLVPLGIRTNVCHMLSSASVPSRNGPWPTWSGGPSMSKGVGSSWGRPRAIQ